ncbi:MAG: gliding motility-associated C-terminal domain-containing protein [Sphingobacteriaceae bacterium]|nr:gliding motility-associated C-terminal domain-containing protein [Sphingobacteriaceae bacterium]
MKRIVLVFALAFLGLSLNAQQVKYYLTQQNAQPWGSISNVSAMNQAFGAGNWIQDWFQTVNVNALLQPSVCLIYCDGGSMAAASMNNFLVANIAAIQTWVFNGGRLFLNAGPNTGFNMNYGFGGITLNYVNGGPYSSPGYAVNPAHPIYLGPAPITATVHQDNFYCHGYVTGPGLTPIIHNTVSPWTTWGQAQQPTGGNIILASKPWGSGMCLFGSMTNTSFHNPQPSAGNLRANMLTWLAVCCIQPTITAAATSTAICSGQTTTITGGGAGIGGTYTINPGTIISNTAAVSPTATTIYTVVGTNSANCQASQTIEIWVNPTPTVTLGSNGPICKGSVLNLTCNASAGNPVLYNWTGPNSYTSSFQNPQVVNAQPTLTGVYFCTVTSVFNNGSCSSIGTTSLTVVDYSSISVNNPTVCQGSALTLTAGVTGASSFTWTGPNNYTANVQNPAPISPVTPLASGDYTIQAAFTASNTTLICNSSAVANVSVVATSPLTLTLPANICEKQTAAVSVSANPAPLSYNWTGPNNFSSNNAVNSITNIPVANTGVYNVTAIWAIGNVSCNINSFGQINVVPVPDIVVNSPSVVCDPSNVELKAFAQGAISYSWNGPNSYTSSIANPILGNPPVSASGVYTITTAFTNGAIMCYNTNTTQVTVNPSLPFTLEPYKQLCFNTTYSIGGPVGATSYTWLGSNGFQSNNQVMVLPFIQANQAGTYTLEVNLGPCKTSAVTSIDVLTPISFTTTPGNVTICDGDSIALIAGASGGSQNYAYVWNPQQWLGSPTGSVQYAYPQGTTIYNLMAYDIACPHYTISNSFTVTVNKGPAPQLTLSKTEGCEPLCLKLNSQVQSLYSQITFDMGNGELYQGDDFDFCYNTAGTYNLKVKTTGKNGCTSTYSVETPIVVHPLPHTVLNYNPDPVTTTENNVTFFPSHSGGNVISYLYEFQGTNGVGGYDSSSMKNPTRSYPNIGKYPVYLISRTDKGCSDSVFKVIEVRDAFSVYIPNTFTPNNDGLNDVFNVKGVGLSSEGYSMEIYDRWGNLVYSTKELTKGWDGKIKDLNGEVGVYVYKVKVSSDNNQGRKEYTGHVSLLK